MILQSWLDICVSRLDNHVSKVNDNHSKVGHTCVQCLILKTVRKMTYTYLHKYVNHVCIFYPSTYSNQIGILTKYVLPSKYSNQVRIQPSIYIIQPSTFSNQVCIPIKYVVHPRNYSKQVCITTKYMFNKPVRCDGSL